MGFVLKFCLFVLGSFVVLQPFIRAEQEHFVFDGRPFGCDQTMVREIDYFITQYNTGISVLQDKKGKKFIVKQEMRQTPYFHLSTARDKLGSYIAKSVDIPANRVEIIPAYAEFPGKHSVQLPATLHTFIPGVLVKSLPKDLREFKLYIQQQNGIGLTRGVIIAMSNHEDLSMIVAFDTFIGNADRHQGNFFYDQKSNRYYAIDLESAFNKNLALYAGKLIESMLNNKTTIISQKELNGLISYRNVLEKLMELHEPMSLYKKLEKYALEGKIMSRIFRSTVEMQLQIYQKAMVENYNSCKKLVLLLNKLIKKHKK